MNVCGAAEAPKASMKDDGLAKIYIYTRIKNIKNVTRCRDSRSAKSVETR